MTITTVKADVSSPLKAYLDTAGDLPQDILLGRIVLFTITDEPVSHQNLVDWFAELDLDATKLPGQIRELDAFKKATSEANKQSYPLSGGRTAHLLCREVTSTNDIVKRQVTREVKDAKRKRLSYDGAIDATFYRQLSSSSRPAMNIVIQANAVEFEEMKPLEGVAKQLGELYVRYRDYHDGAKLRGLVREYLKHLNAIQIKGGVYFIHATRDEELSRLTELVNRFGGDCEMNTIPIVNLERERKLIAQAFEREASQQLQEVTKECKDLLSTRKSITDAAYIKVRARYDEVLEKAQEHMITLQVSQDVTAASAEVALTALKSLQEAAAT